MNDEKGPKLQGLDFRDVPAHRKQYVWFLEKENKKCKMEFGGAK